MKMVEREAFLMKPKHQCHLSQWVTRIYSAQLWKEKRLLFESMFVPIDRWTLILRKMGEKNFFLMKSKHQFIYPNYRNEFMVPNHGKKGDYYDNTCLSHCRKNFTLRKMVDRVAFLMKPKL